MAVKKTFNEKIEKFCFSQSFVMVELTFKEDKKKINKRILSRNFHENVNRNQ